PNRDGDLTAMSQPEITPAGRPFSFCHKFDQNGCQRRHRLMHLAKQSCHFRYIDWARAEKLRLKIVKSYLQAKKGLESQPIVLDL
ncbi:MAG: hypothetical protein AAGF30_16750, partial [Pseudomonadota bacterium]